MNSRLLAAGLAMAALAAGPARAVTNLISGEVTGTVTWSGTNLLEGTVIIRAGAVVTIESGTRMLMHTGAVLQVQGQLLADGTAAAPIQFTRDAAGSKWKRILFLRAADSRLRHCVIEYADSVGDHKDYYDNDCNPSTPPLPRNYHEAVVVLAGHVDFEGCIFQKLPDSSSSAEGDALAIISDDPQVPGTASATVRSCQFLGMGQGVHTRFAHVLVETCVFRNKHGDNDDVDLYGESTPPAVIRFNLFAMPNHDDRINPTRCSALIYGNVIEGCDDHGIVLRDACAPVVFNNLIYGCANGGIAIQNQCDALIVNNTIINCGRGVRFFDHFDRHGPPYCLAPGSGRATIVNCVIWDCPESLVLTDSPDGQSHANVSWCDIEGGQAGATVSAGATLVWGPGNLDADPRFVSLANTNLHLLTNSPCIDAGTNMTGLVGVDYDGTARPLDGNGDGTAAPDIGAYEFLLAGADSNGDGIPDGWCRRYGLNPVDPAVAGGDPDLDRHTTLEEWVADTDPTNALSVLRIVAITNGPMVAVQFPGSSNRQYTLFSVTNFSGSDPVHAAWTNVPGQVDISGVVGMNSLADTNAAPPKFYRVGVKVP